MELTKKVPDKFQSTPSARRATVRSMPVPLREVISIHALREEGDAQIQTLFGCKGNFNPRPPRGGRQGVTKVINETAIFQSTPSARRATQVAKMSFRG